MRGPAPTYRPTFPSEFLAQAQKIVHQRTVRYQLRQRATLVLLFHEQPLVSETEAAACVHMHSNSVRLWRRRWANGTFVLEDESGRGPQPGFPPLDHAVVKAIACEVVYETARPLSRQSLGDLTVRACRTLSRPISRSTVWRMLHAEALKPWRYEYWIFPRDLQFAEKAAVALDLHAGVWEGQLLSPRDYILSADEKTSLQARLRCHPSLGPAPGRHRRVEFEYDRGGALQYLAAWDVGRGYVRGRCEPSTGIEPFGRLVTQVMEQEPYRSAERVVWVVDNGSSHRGQAAVQRLLQAYPHAIVVHTPIHSSWLNQVEIYLSLVQRKVLTPNDFASLTEVGQRLRLYEELCNQRLRPFQWNFAREKLIQFLDRLEARQIAQRQALTAPEKSRQVA